MANFTASVSVDTSSVSVKNTKTGAEDTTYNNTFKVGYATALNKLISFDTAGSKELGKSKFLMINNVGEQTVECAFTLVPFARSNDTKTDNQFRVISFLLKPDEFVTLPTTKILHYNPNATDQDPWGGTPVLESAADANELTFIDVDENGHKQPVSGGSTIDTALNDGDNIDTTDTAIVVDSAHGYCFKKYDYIMIDSEIMFITEANHATNFTVERAALGTTPASHLNNANIYLYCANVKPNDASHSAVNTAINSSGTVMTSANGSFYASNFFGYGRTASATGPQGLTPGSIAIKFYNGAWQDWGMSNQTPDTDTKLAANTAYAFNLALDGTTHADISFTTDASDTTWGNKSDKSVGVLRKIQDALDAEVTSNVVAKCTIEIIGGDIRITSYGNHTGSSVAVAGPGGGGTTPFGVGIIPIIGNIHEGQPGYFNDNEDTPFIMFDDGNGNLRREAGGSGTINYRTGAITLENCPPQANMRIACKYEAALSGYEHGEQNNQLVSISASSTNTYRDGYIQIVSVDDKLDDNNVELMTEIDGEVVPARRTGVVQRGVSKAPQAKPGATASRPSSY